MCSRRTVSIIFLALFPLFEVGCYALLYKKRSEIVIRKRNANMIRIASLAGWLAFINLIVSVAGGINCAIFYLLSLLVFPMAAGPQLIRSIVLWGMLEQSNLKLKEELSGVHRLRREGSSSEKKNGTALASVTEEAEMFDHKSVLEKVGKVKKRMDDLVSASEYLLAVLPVGFFVYAATTTDDDRMTSTNFEECLPEPGIIRNIGPAIGLVIAALALTATALVRHCDDELGIRQEITRNNILLVITYAGILAIRFSGHYEWQPLMQTIQQMLLSFSMIVMPCFHRTGGFRFLKSKKRVVPGYGRPLPDVPMARKRTSMMGGRRSTENEIKSDNERRREMTISLDAGLCILLSTKEGIKAFSEHCAREFSVENIKFWCAVSEYHAEMDMSLAPSDDAAETQETSHIITLANEIYQIYIMPGAEFQVNVPAAIASQVKKDLDSGEIKRDLFDSAQKEIFALMSRDSYPRFLASKRHHASMMPQQGRTTLRRLSMIPSGQSSKSERGP